MTTPQSRQTPDRRLHAWRQQLQGITPLQREWMRRIYATLEPISYMVEVELLWDLQDVEEAAGVSDTQTWISATENETSEWDRVSRAVAVASAMATSLDQRNNLSMRLWKAALAAAAWVKADAAAGRLFAELLTASTGNNDLIDLLPLQRSAVAAVLLPPTTAATRT